MLNLLPQLSTKCVLNLGFAFQMPLKKKENDAYGPRLGHLLERFRPKVSKSHPNFAKITLKPHETLQILEKIIKNIEKITKAFSPATRPRTHVRRIAIETFPDRCGAQQLIDALRFTPSHQLGDRQALPRFRQRKV